MTLLCPVPQITYEYVLHMLYMPKIVVCVWYSRPMNQKAKFFSDRTRPHFTLEILFQ